MWNVSGISGAAPVWVEIMNRLHRNETSRKPRPPAGLVQRLVDIPDIAQSRQEWFIEGTESALVRQAGGSVSPRIAYPPAGTVVALDPDIPPEDQKLFFEADPEGSGLEWVLDGRSMGTADLMPWAPRNGKHVLVLRDGLGRPVDSVTFEVRGN